MIFKKGYDFAIENVSAARRNAAFPFNNTGFVVKVHSFQYEIRYFYLIRGETLTMGFYVTKLRFSTTNVVLKKQLRERADHEIRCVQSERSDQAKSLFQAINQGVLVSHRKASATVTIE